MDENRPLVSIGMPVYNGMPYLQEALDSLLAQTHSDFELVIRDNASTDGTEAVCRRAAAASPQVRYTRNAENLGPVINFRKVLQDARGKYFMWAAHDDLWNPGYIAALAAALQQCPAAVLATPRTIHVDEDGTRNASPVEPPASPRGTLSNLRVFYRSHAASWIYGLYDAQWLREHVHEFETENYPVWSGDILWLTALILRHPLTGSPEATISKRDRPNSHAPRTEAEAIRCSLMMASRLTSMCLRHSRTMSIRAAALPLSWHYSYQRYFRKSNPLKLLRRFAMLPGVTLGWLFEHRGGWRTPQREASVLRP